MSDEEIGLLGEPVVADGGLRSQQRFDWTLVRCTCGEEASVPTSQLPLELRPVRHVDGVRMALCAACQPQPNRAQRRGRR